MSSKVEEHLRRIIDFFDDFGPEHPATHAVLGYGMGKLIEDARDAIKMRTRPYGRGWDPNRVKPKPYPLFED